MSRLRRLAAGTVGALVLTSGLVAVTGVSSQAGPSDSSMLRQRASVAWAGASYRGNDTATVAVPGIGTAKIVCRRNSTMLSIRPDDRTKETQMWSAVRHTKTDASGRPYQSVAVKNARVYRWANADDDGTGGTGRSANEGFNQVNRRIEDSSSGSMRGVISQRPGRNRSAADARTPSSTSFTVTWKWSGFRGARKGSRCTVTGVFETQLGTKKAGRDARRAVKDADAATVRVRGKKVRVGVSAKRYEGRSTTLALNWHGDADAARRTSSARTIPGLGTLQLSCGTGRHTPAYLTIRPPHSNAVFTAETIAGEGDVRDHVDKGRYGYDPSTAALVPVSLPSNGMVRGRLTVGSRQVDVTISSYRITNNVPRPHLNLCEIAVAVTPA